MVTYPATDVMIFRLSKELIAQAVSVNLSLLDTKILGAARISIGELLGKKM